MDICVETEIANWLEAHIKNDIYASMPSQTK